MEVRSPGQGSVSQAPSSMENGWGVYREDPKGGYPSGSSLWVSWSVVSQVAECEEKWPHRKLTTCSECRAKVQVSLRWWEALGSRPS